ncbi:MAG: TetR/AcrR family transcriptional regulator [Candidatus Sericytochromatia bacterium]
MEIKKRASSSETRGKILETADRLFYEHGIKSVGIDTIIAESGVAKMSLYKHFSSKENLAIEFLNNRDKAFFDFFEKTLDNHNSKNPILDFFKYITNSLCNNETICCPFLNVSVEFPEIDNPIHKTILEHKTKIKNKLEATLKKMSLDDVEIKADHIILLWHGLIMNKKIFGNNYNTKNFLAFIEEITYK